MVEQRSLFVFGSFSEGMVHFKKIAPYVEGLRPASVRGTLYRLPSGMIVMLNEGSHAISGHVADLKNGDFLFSLLDGFHGVDLSEPSAGLFFRSEIATMIEEGAVETVFGYFMNPRKLPRGAAQIDGGDWLRSINERTPLFEKLTERQRAYILRLGASSGRDIVPIDLVLYRELMHLEIVVDKGRRLALSPLGQDLYRLLV